MTRLAPAVTLAAVAALTGCGGGSGSPKAAPTTATPMRPASPEAAAIRGLARKTLAACPCSVEVTLFSIGFEHETFTGVYDPRSQNTELHAKEDPKFVVRIVDGRVYFNHPEAGRWIVLDFSGVPKPGAKSPLPAFVVADPRIAFAFASHVTFATLNQTNAKGKMYDAEFDPRATAADTGPWAGAFRRLFPDPTYYHSAWLRADGRFEFDVEAAYGVDDHLAATLVVTKTGVHAGPIVAPTAAGRLDANAAG